MAVYEDQPVNADYFVTNQDVLSEGMYIPPLVVPPFVRKIGALAAEDGFANAVVDVFGDANISFELDGDLSTAAGRGLMIVGDHSQKLEPLLVQAAMSKAGRDASRVIAMPVSFAGRHMQSTDSGKELIIPVVPSGWGESQKLSLGDARTKLRRTLYPKILGRPKDEVRAMNMSSLSSAAEYVSLGETATIFPTGGPIDGVWQKGVGVIASKIAPESRPTTHVAAFKPEQFSIKSVLSSLLLRDMGIKPRKQTIVLGVRTLGTIEDMQGGPNNSPAEFTAAIRDKCFTAFDL